MFQIKIQSPFTSNPVAYHDCNAAEASRLYEAIDWADLYAQLEATGSSAESDFYYYEISSRNSIGEEQSLCISGYIRALVCLGYFRPKMERKGFFKKKDVLNPAFQTQMDGMDIPFAGSCLEAFLRGDHHYLEQELYDKEMD